jgi:predicted ATPase
VKHELIHFDFARLQWDWDEDGIAALEVSDDIVDFLVQNTLQDGLQKETLEILKLASCLGKREFNSRILSLMLGMSIEEVTVISQAC